MASLRLLAGGLIVLFVLVVNLVTADITTGDTTASYPVGCTATDTNVTCERVGKTTFFASVLHTSVHGIDGAPDIVNASYLVVTGFLFIIGVFLMLLSFIPFTS